MIKKICNDDAQIFPYIARLPLNMKDNLPIIIQLHGAGERGMGTDKDIDRVEVHGFSHVFTDEAQIECILIQPQCRPDSFWVAHIQELRLFIEEIIRTYNADENRVYLTGLSMGGYGTWYTALAFPEMFAAIAPVCGGGMPWMADRLTMPIWAFHGTDDDAVLPSNSIDMINALRRCGRGDDVRFTLKEHVGHNVWEYAYRQELLDWLLARKKA